MNSKNPDQPQPRELKTQYCYSNLCAGKLPLSKYAGRVVKISGYGQKEVILIEASGEELVKSFFLPIRLSFGILKISHSIGAEIGAIGTFDT